MNLRAQASGNNFYAITRGQWPLPFAHCVHGIRPRRSSGGPPCRTRSRHARF
jgi:hypothetical protein